MAGDLSVNTWANAFLAKPFFEIGADEARFGKDHGGLRPVDAFAQLFGYWAFDGRDET